MPMSEFISWTEYAQVEPFGSHFDDLRAGAVCAATYNVNRDVDKRPEPFLPLDFMPWNAQCGHQAQPEVQGTELTPDQLSALIDARMFGRIH